MDYFGEWTTSSARNRERGRKPGESQELVAHFKEWTTLKSGPLAGAEAEEKARKLEKSHKLHPTKKRPAMPVAFDLFCRWPGLDDWFRLVFDEGVICDIRHDWYHIVLIFLAIWCEDIVDDLAR